MRAKLILVLEDDEGNEVGSAVAAGPTEVDTDNIKRIADSMEVDANAAAAIVVSSRLWRELLAPGQLDPTAMEALTR